MKLFMEKLNITGLTLEEMEQLMVSIGQPKYRAKQLFTWLYKKRIHNLEQITVFSKTLRQELLQFVNIEHLEIAKQQISSDRETNKFLFRLQDGSFVESVFIVDGKRRTVC